MNYNYFSVALLSYFLYNSCMSKNEKLFKRLLSKPKDFTYNELRRLLTGLGYSETQSGKTSGSRVAFINESTHHIIRLHKPHPGNELKQYQIEQLIEEFNLRGLI
jgi:hypothetical protein